MNLRKPEEMQRDNTVYCENDTDCRLLRYFNGDGDVLSLHYQVFPGISLQHNDVHAGSCTINAESDNDIFEIHHCREGRMEGSSGEAFYYMEPGDLAICRPEKRNRCRHFPLCHYHGITITVDVKEAPLCLSCFLDDVRVQPGLLMEKFCTTPNVFVEHSKPAVEHIFSELYSVPEQIRKGYFKVKILELFLFLSCMDPHADELSQRSYSNSQRQLAMEVSRYVAEHMDSKITLDRLADHFHASATQIKCSVKSVYGKSVYSYIRSQKMSSAAKLLRDTDYSVAEIAGHYGYDNAGKFAGAFKAVIGATPTEYRRKSLDKKSPFGAEDHPFGAEQFES